MGTIKVGMSYDEVIRILGEPKTQTRAQGIITCTWSRAVIRGITNNYTITFKDGNVISIGGHSNWN